MKFLFQTEDRIASLIIRVTLGMVFFFHGAQKFLGWYGGFGFTGTVGFFTSQLQIPYLLAVLIVFTEFFGSLGLIAGLLSRIAAFGIACVMAGGIWMIHWQNGFSMNWYGKQAGEGIEFSLLVLGMSLALIISGSGKWSLDRIISNKMAK
ncbi:MAG: DoxX family protein [Nitrospirae bacterium]|nr:DoxX family protein [Nitrospirota bacterium]MBI3594108.1 DoxX family protein [Nitrospirota bacterium]